MSNDKLPKDANGLQLNFCKTLACDNFGLSNAERYVLQHVNPKRPMMVCRECGSFPPLLNNQDVLNELKRLRTVHNDGLAACRHAECENFGKSVHTNKNLYHSFGYSGDRQRYRCKGCHSTFVDKWSGNNAKLSFQESVLGLLFTGFSVKDICRKLQVNPKTFYDHVNHIASRCRRKLAMFDARWVNHAQHYQLASHFMPLQPQSHNGVLWFATGEAESGYILSQHINYSADDEPCGPVDHDPYASPARYISREYAAEANVSIEVTSQDLLKRIDEKYQVILTRSNVEDPMGNMAQFNYPSKGALIRPPYTSYAHFMQIFDLCDHSKPMSIYLPQDPILRSAALSLCSSTVKRRDIDLIYVEEDPSWDKNLMIDKVDIVHMGWWKDRWAISTQENASKGICYLAGENPSPQTWINKASIRKTAFYQDRFQLIFDSFINEPRRKLRPAGILPMLDIFRAWHNLCYQDKDGKTPAQELAITDQPLTLKQLLS
ncbi:transposase [Vibrio sp. MA40-2]|uniref:transposase n=1 Tax=Vibrio sp. MA40-2 TaxID=3391828 RepID=UPI0039A5DF22